MLAAPAPYNDLHRSFSGPADTIKRDIRDVTTGDNFYTTPEMSGQLRAISSGIDHIKLDNEILKSSSDWARRFSPGTLRAEKQGALTTLDKTASVIHDLKNHNATRNAQQMVDNQTRELHHWSMRNLQGVKKEVVPYASASVDRLHQFCDHMGVTDRYTGYRHNLNRGNLNPTRLGTQWMDTQRNAYNTTLNVGWKPTTTRPLTDTQQRAGVPPSYVGDQTIGTAPAPPQPNMMRASAPADQLRPGPVRAAKSKSAVSKSIQEQCGINTRFPGTPEYMDRYSRPTTTPNIGFKINPSPDFYMHGRPLATLLPDKSFTEYQTRYEWPNGERITRFPWLRK